MRKSSIEKLEAEVSLIDLTKRAQAAHRARTRREPHKTRKQRRIENAELAREVRRGQREGDS